MNGISSSRKVAYYAGIVIQVIGLGLFLSFFFTVACGISEASHQVLPASSDMPDFSEVRRRIEDGHRIVEHQGELGAFAFVRALVGFVMLIVGSFLQRVGKVGLAGSGVVLDPEGARQDVKPWSRAVGGMVNDAIDESGAAQRLVGDLRGARREVVKVRCPSCSHLNDEHSRFCNQCGKSI